MSKAHTEPETPSSTGKSSENPGWATHLARYSLVVFLVLLCLATLACTIYYTFRVELLEKRVRILERENQQMNEDIEAYIDKKLQNVFKEVSKNKSSRVEIWIRNMNISHRYIFFRKFRISFKVWNAFADSKIIEYSLT